MANAKNVVKKHVSMMNEWEKGYIEHVILPKAKVKVIGEHAKERMVERHINYTLKDFAKDITMDNLIEFNNKYGVTRMLFRSKKVIWTPEKKYCNVVFVLSANYEIISCWVNNVNDFHNTLKYEQYSPKMSVKKLWSGWGK